ncbi:Rab GTPase-activating protein MSB4 KNAG_0A01460 [Huiozyma naganishii CBS 8797]|uniref:Rab-GAP TBC domain-containing protein n=1 Tax=Huiozyma naganishii (strain ATCC MYA-139 / BCRC 22969 / CBS 8797 / KCTC 17520 / NBRC 10181 / NCYC 3082 / Yp74L-3) TaxID=1071383 RepID=J7QZE3_HUIN7|nr:hypothetical protein KNAG_0A01460 [Kazachstania naganishii CBS 8797]CCK67835.1 hypothetical protein KNAG_0A01460 [Kazachstania naganishii CBS 8797]
MNCSEKELPAESSPTKDEFKKCPSTPNLQNIRDLSSEHHREDHANGYLPIGNRFHQEEAVSPSAGSGRGSLLDLYGDDDNSYVQVSPTPSHHSLRRRSTDAGGNRTSTTRSVHSTTTKRRSAIPELQNLDRYGFRKQNNYITLKDYDNWWQNYSKYCVRRKHKWQLFLTKSGLSLNGDSPTKFPPQSEKLKRYVRKGIPAEWRGNAWWYFARGDEMLNKHKGLYDKLVDKCQAEKVKVRDIDVIERDLNRTFPDNIHFHRESFQVEDPLMIRSLRRVLVAFSLYDPNIGYCQSMNFLVGLLLFFMNEERAFWMLVIITKKYLPEVHSVNLEGVNIDQGVLILCIKQYLPELWTKMESTYTNDGEIGSSDQQDALKQMEILNKLPPITLSTASWFMSCFIGVVPIETTLRIWDCLFYEKSHFLFKVSLAIFKLCEGELVEKKPSLLFSQNIFASFSNESLLSNHTHDWAAHQNMNRDDYDMILFQVIQTFPKKLLNPNDIFDKVLFKKKIPLNKLDQDEIDKIRKYVISQRKKWVRFNKVLKKGDSSSSAIVAEAKVDSRNAAVSKEFGMSDDMIADVLASELSGFKRMSLAGVDWNTNIKARVKQMKQQGK